MLRPKLQNEDFDSSLGQFYLHLNLAMFYYIAKNCTMYFNIVRILHKCVFFSKIEFCGVSVCVLYIITTFSSCDFSQN